MLKRLMFIFTRIHHVLKPYIMKLLKLLVLTFLLNTLNNYAQISHYNATGTFKIDDRTRDEKEHEGSELNDISVLDLVDMLQFQGIEINKFKLGTFDKKYKLYIIKDEYLHGEIVSSDTLIDLGNAYNYYIAEKRYYDFIDQITILTKQIPDEKKSQFIIKTFASSISGFIEMKNTDKENILYWRRYTETEWKLNKKIPLLIYASTWLDEKNGFRRFCGPNNLKEDDKDTIDLLKYSPNYVKLSYIVCE